MGKGLFEVVCITLHNNYCCNGKLSLKLWLGTWYFRVSIIIQTSCPVVVILPPMVSSATALFYDKWLSL